MFISKALGTASHYIRQPHMYRCSSLLSVASRFPNETRLKYNSNNMFITGSVFSLIENRKVYKAVLILSFHSSRSEHQNLASLGGCLEDDPTALLSSHSASRASWNLALYKTAETKHHGDPSDSNGPFKSLKEILFSSCSHSVSIDGIVVLYTIFASLETSL